MAEVTHYDGLTPAWLAALRSGPQSARELAMTLGQGTSRSNVAAIRATLERMERQGLVQRTREAPREPWVWEVCGDG
jgi:DNA-binding PadR family transcriptional regulator